MSAKYVKASRWETDFLMALLPRQRKRHISGGSIGMWCGICTTRANGNQQVCSPVNLIHHRGATHTGCATERRGPEDVTGIVVECVDRAITAETKQQTAGRHYDAVVHLRQARAMDALSRERR